MINLKQFKQEKKLHSDEEYNSVILQRTAKNKAMIAFTSVAIGGGVFLGLLVPGLLPVVLQGAPLLAMSTNVMYAGIAGASVGAAHYAVNYKDAKFRKQTRQSVNYWKNKLDAEIIDDDAEKTKYSGIANENKLKSDLIFNPRREKLKMLKQQRDDMIASGVGGLTLTLKERKIEKLEKDVQKLSDRYDLAKAMYEEDLDKLKEKALSKNYKPTVIPNNEATKRFKAMLNLHTPTLEENSDFVLNYYLQPVITETKEENTEEKIN